MNINLAGLLIVICLIVAFPVSMQLSLWISDKANKCKRQIVITYHKHIVKNGNIETIFIDKSIHDEFIECKSLKEKKLTPNIIERWI